MDVGERKSCGKLNKQIISVSLVQFSIITKNISYKVYNCKGNDPQIIMTGN